MKTRQSSQVMNLNFYLHYCRRNNMNQLNLQSIRKERRTREEYRKRRVKVRKEMCKSENKRIRGQKETPLLLRFSEQDQHFKGTLHTCWNSSHPPPDLCILAPLEKQRKLFRQRFTNILSIFLHWVILCLKTPLKVFINPESIPPRP